MIPVQCMRGFRIMPLCPCHSPSRSKALPKLPKPNTSKLLNPSCPPLPTQNPETFKLKKLSSPRSQDALGSLSPSTGDEKPPSASGPQASRTEAQAGNFACFYWVAANAFELSSQYAETIEFCNTYTLTCIFVFDGDAVETL